MELAKAKAIRPADVDQIYMENTNAGGMLRIVLDLEESRGLNLVDQLTGRTYLDFFGFFASSAIGMNHPKMRSDKDFLERLMDASINKITNSDVRSVHMARFLRTFSRLAKPDYLPYSFFVSGGALAVENALKTAFDWKVRKNFEKGYEREIGHQVLHFTESFHGRSGYTLSLTNTADPRKVKYFPRFDWPRVANPKMEFPVDEHLAEIEQREKDALAEIKEHFRTRKDEIACVIIEPIQGEGGDNHFRREFLETLRDVTHENDALLVFDEVQTGVGMTGSFWAHQAIGVEPDIISFGKKTQVCGILAGRKLDEVSDHVFQEKSRINSTWGGNIVDMVRFDRILEIMEEDRLVENADTVGTHLLNGLYELQKSHPTVSNVRGRGLFCAIDVPDTAFRDRVLKSSFDGGLIMLGCGRRSVRFRTPLTVTEEEIDRGLSILASALEMAATGAGN